MAPVARIVLRSATAALAGLTAVLALPPWAPAQAQTAGAPVYRCGSSYSNTPCPGGAVVDADDARSAALRKEAQAVKRRDAEMADQLAAERRARERAALGQQPVGIGPAAANAPPPKASAGTDKPKKYRRTDVKPPSGAASQSSSQSKRQNTSR